MARRSACKMQERGVASVQGGTAGEVSVGTKTHSGRRHVSVLRQWCGDNGARFVALRGNQARLVRVAVGAEGGGAKRSDECVAIDRTVRVRFGRESDGHGLRHHLVSVAQTQCTALERQEIGLQARYGESLVRDRSPEMGPTTSSTR